MIINMEIEDITTEYAHRHISLKTSLPDISYFENRDIIRVLHRNVEVILKLEDLVKQRYILHLRVYNGHSIEINDMINLYKCIYYKEKYKQTVDKLNEKEKVFKLIEEEKKIREDLVDNYNIMLTLISEIFNRYHLRNQTMNFNMSSDEDRIIEHEYINY